MSVTIREQSLNIPTYPVGAPEKNPIFYTGRAYQGAKGPMYPYPLLDKLSNTREDRAYRALELENPYLQLTIIPELGGRLFAAQDRTNGYDFIYRQGVIKPSLIGMVGAWISGGAEWDLPHHHRASTFMPVEYTTTENADGSKTVHVGEIEWRHRMKWTAGVTLFPDRSYLETKITLRNRTPLVHTMLCFTNLAVHVNEAYRVIFPPATQFGVQHAKCEFIHWPVAQGSYSGSDFRGVDVSWWKNHPNWISIFAWNQGDDFFGGYDHARDTGIVHVADRHTVPGKKFFEFGNGTPGQMYDKILTDEDGPYVELMAGAYSDNQPDYSWIQPYEVKTVRQYWYPLRGMGGLKQANLEGALNLDVVDGQIRFAVNATREHRRANVVLKAGEKVLAQGEVHISPDRPFAHQVPLPRGVGETDLRLAMVDERGRELVAYRPAARAELPTPAVVVPPGAPAEIATNEETLLAGQRLEQFHSPAAEPEPYYLEVLKRDAGDSRANTALGILYYRRGRFADARARLEAALARVTRNYTRPRSGEAHYYLGLTLRMQGELAAAEDQLNRAAWDFAWRAASYFELAQLAVIRGDFDVALQYADDSLAHNSLNHSGHCLRAVILRKQGREGEARAALAIVLQADPLDFWAMHESIACAEDEARLMEQMRGEPRNHLELASEYARCHLWSEAAAILQRYLRSADGPSYPLVHYTLAYYLERMGEPTAAGDQYRLARAAAPEYCFPYQLESMKVLRSAMAHNATDARAPYYLGNLLYDLQPEAALDLWETSRELDPAFATVHRNLALAYARQRKDRAAAIASLERAVALDPADARLHFELDVLRDAEGVPADERLAHLEEHQATIRQRDDVLLRQINLYNLLGNHDRALELLGGHHFHVWEGGESIAHDAYTDAHLIRGRGHLAHGCLDAALADFLAAMEYPERFEMGRPHDGGRIGEAAYLAGRALEALGRADEARAQFEAATAKLKPGTQLAYYQALALRKLGRDAEATDLLERLARSAAEQLEKKPAVDFFEKFGSQEDDRRQRANAHYLLGLGRLGLGDAAEPHFAEALALNPNHLGAKVLSKAEMRI